MKIKRLELVGFKSFVDPTVIDFDSPIVAVVGPNGSGKSNIVDAIRWVMGEMSAKSLRGKGMEDVIFSGCDGRPAVGMAEVSLTFSTGDGIAPAQYAGFSEITIARRLYRSGESEYLINKVPGRLRDIIELFLGTGVGHKAYSIIEQGRIDFAINAKPEDRRLLIEEAAGISKFKARKEAAIRKIESAEQNLARLRDIQREVTRQINSLDRQVKKAEKYKTLKNEVRELEVRLAATGFLEQQQESQELRTLLSDWTVKESSASAHLATVETQLQTRRLEQAEKDRELTELQEKFFEASNRLQLSQAQEEFQKKEIKGLEEQIQRGEQEVGRLQEQLVHLSRERGTLEAQAAELGVGEANPDLEKVRHDLQTAKECFKTLKENETNLREQIASKQERKEILDGELRIRREELVQKRSRMKSLTDLEKNFEGYDEGVRTLLKARKEGVAAAEILGVVADCMETPAEYETAVSAALGEKLQYVVVKSHEEGVSAIGYLKEQAAGRGAFIPLAVRESETKPFPYQTEGVIGPLLSHVHLKEEYQQIAQHLLGDVVLVRSLDDALTLWRSNGHKKTLVTLEGEVVDPHGIVSGGTDSIRGKILLEKKRELKELRAVVGELEEQIGLQEDAASQMEGELSDLALQREEFSRQSHAEELRLTGLQKEADHLVQSLQQKQSTARQGIESLLKREREMGQKIEEEKNRVADSRQKIQGLLKESGERRASEGPLAETVSQLSLSQEELKRTYEEAAGSTQILEDSLKGIRKELDLARSHCGDLRVTLSKLEGDLHHLQTQILEKYAVSLSETAESYREGVVENRGAEEAQLTELKEQLEKMGDVNLGAIPEYEELKERQQFLTTQIKDLEESLETIRKAIIRINQTTRRRFEETFALVNERFQTLMPRLFRGGRAELRLITDGDFQNGVELFAQPPGKKLSHVGLLSGGEKAMAALAFVFSIFLVKPSPFCILDEVDAPLDDTNVDRFHNLLTEMTSRSQFILITHNRRTMERADLLYGITMQEPGVSKVVSVKLSEALPLAS